MERFIHWLAWGTVFVIMLFAGFNWSALSTPMGLNLLVTEVQAPLGIILLAMTTVFVVLFFAATLYSRIGVLLESRRLLKEVQRAHNLAEEAEASRLENLHHLIATEFRLLNARLESLTAGAQTGSDAFKPASLTDIVSGRSDA